MTARTILACRAVHRHDIAGTPGVGNDLPAAQNGQTGFPYLEYKSEILHRLEVENSRNIILQIEQSYIRRLDVTTAKAGGTIGCVRRYNQSRYN